MLRQSAYVRALRQWDEAADVAFVAMRAKLVFVTIANNRGREKGGLNRNEGKSLANRESALRNAKRFRF